VPASYGLLRALCDSSSIWRLSVAWVVPVVARYSTPGFSPLPRAQSVRLGCPPGMPVGHRRARSTHQFKRGRMSAKPVLNMVTVGFVPGGPGGVSSHARICHRVYVTQIGGESVLYGNTESNQSFHCHTIWPSARLVSTRRSQFVDGLHTTIAYPGRLSAGQSISNRVGTWWTGGGGTRTSGLGIFPDCSRRISILVSASRDFIPVLSFSFTLRLVLCAQVELMQSCERLSLDT